MPTLPLPSPWLVNFLSDGWLDPLKKIYVCHNYDKNLLKIDQTFLMFDE